MKIGLFTDPHYKGTNGDVRLHKDSLDKIKSVLSIFKNEGCALAICLGDIIDTEPKHKLEVENLRAVKKEFDDSGIEMVALMGNHDGFCFTPEEFYEVLGEEYRPKTIHCGDKTLIFADANFFANGTRYAPGDTDWTNTYLPDIERIKSEIEASLGDCYLFIHQSVDPNICESHRIANDEELRQMLEDTGKVRAVIQGHYHDGARSEHAGIDYITVSAMCEHELPYFILEI
jgi:predicted phosphodiesterase